MFCEEKETFTHIMLYCVHVSNFWTKVNHFVWSMLNVRIPIEEKTLVIGYLIHDKKFTLANMIFVFAQYAIYKSYIMYEMQRKYFHSVSIWREFKNELLFYVNWYYKSNKHTINMFNSFIQ